MVNKKILLSVTVIAMLTLSSGVAWADEVTSEINYQGRLADSAGSPLTGTYEMTFRLYEAASGGTALDTDAHKVEVIDGLFNTHIGFGQSYFDGREEITVKSENGADTCIIDCQRTEAEPHRGFYPQSEVTSEGCTIGVANGSVTADGRPILWKVRDTSNERQQLCYTAGDPHDYIGVRSEDDTIYMGLNEAGVATGNSLVKTPGGSAPNSLFQQHILENYDSLGQIRDYIQSKVNAGTCNAAGYFPFIDKDGDAIMFGVNRSHWFLEYDSMDPDREAQDIRGFVVRANEFHQRSDGTDDTSIGGRYESGTYNVKGLVGIDELSARTIIQGNDYANGFEFVRYGPGRTYSNISRTRSGVATRSAIAVHGVAPDEDPALATMWVILGQTNYGIAVPTWVKVSNIPQCLSSGDMYARAQSLCNKGHEATTQASTFPVETHTFNIVVNTFLPHWRAEGVPSVAEMTRIEHQIASDAYSLLDCLDNRQSDNKAPQVTFNAIPHELTVDFTLIADDDADGNIEDIEWNFGDDQTSPATSPSHTYTEPGTYLVSCTVTDDDSVSITDWRYCNVSAEADTTPPASVSNLDETDKGATWIQWGWTNPPDPDFSHTKVYIDGVFKADVNAPGNSYNEAGLSPGTTYTIGTMTVDNSGNINDAEVTDTATTSSEADTTPPASVSNLDETDKGATWIKWGWTNPSDPDFSHTKVYIDGVFKADVNAPGDSYRATSLSPDTTYEIGTRTVDDSDNMNAAEVTDTATTLSEADTIPVPSITPLGTAILIGSLSLLAVGRIRRRFN